MARKKHTKMSERYTLKSLSDIYSKFDPICDKRLKINKNTNSYFTHICVLKIPGLFELTYLYLPYIRGKLLKPSAHSSQFSYRLKHIYITNRFCLYNRFNKQNYRVLISYRIGSIPQNHIPFIYRSYTKVRMQKLYSIYSKFPATTHFNKSYIASGIYIDVM